ncbi:hypothetical protein GCM10008018_59690 [Paenibacillus marchantiophytorum]|uniref:HTH tetR-type domain-containing protein n=1 Tax=Paenibacillus marchantiophytorum TaxID=1619310 RepID=A0ABQ1FBL3_9BACL|nr:hypothetical protein GCM10008018_59690 [Paenibacillus marchantiophytorum]
MNTTNRTIVSRRSRPAKAPLSKEVIIKTALELLRKEGSSGLSMRKIAKVLDTGPSSLYVYVTNLQELNDYVLDLGLEEVPLPDVYNDENKAFPLVGKGLICVGRRGFPPSFST